MAKDKSEKIDQQAKLECPKCIGMLQNKEVGEMEGKPIYIDQCFSCSGIWFDEGEFEKMMALKLQADDDVELKDFNPSMIGDELDLKKADCPRCKKEMNRISSPQDGRVKIDYCLGCGGTWLDGGEIRLLLRGGPIKRGLKFLWDKISAPLRQAQESRRR